MKTWLLAVVALLSLWIASVLLLRYSILPLGQGLPASLAMYFRAERFWIYAHVFCASVALLLGPWQFLPWLRRRLKAWHRNAGRIYLLVGIGCGGIAALMLALVSVSGWIARTGFATVAALWLYTAWRGFDAVLRGDIEQHRAFMLRNFSLTFGAVTLRLYLAATSILGLPFDQAYPLIAWISWAPNLILVEWLLRRRQARETGPMRLQ